MGSKELCDSFGVGPSAVNVTEIDVLFKSLRVSGWRGSGNAILRVTGQGNNSVFMDKY